MGHRPSSARSPRRGSAVVLAALCATGLVSGTVAPAASASPGDRPLRGSGQVGAAQAVAALDPGLPVSGSALQRVVVTGAPGGLTAVRDAVTAVGGALGRPLPLVDGASARVRADRLRELAGQPGVVAVTADRTAPVSTLQWDGITTASNHALTSAATGAWAAGARGQGVGVAVLDTGVSPHADLAGRLVAGPDLSGEEQHDRDSFGHGTVMAGAVAGNGADSAPANRTGIAPAAHVVSIKVAGANGAADVSTVLAGMHWAASFKDDYNIRVLNLSWGVPSTQDPAVDPLSVGVQRLWQAGITVVVAAGNSGPHPGTVTKPGDDPVVITVGAYDDRNDLLASNDVVPKWSSQGPTAQGLVKPDLVAPGRTLVLPRAAGSAVETSYPKALVAPSYIKGSGTSQAAAVVSGAAALLLSARPTLTPDQVKAALRGTASPMASEPVTAQGAGRLQVLPALTADVSGVLPQPMTATGTGTLDASRGAAARVQVSCDGAAKVLDDETTAWCAPWSGISWKNDAWSGISWKSTGWSGISWKADAWSGISWKNASWSGISWKGDQWSGISWKSADWSGISWKNEGWSTAAYGDDDLFLTSFWGNNPPHWVTLPGETSEPAPVGQVTSACAVARGCRR